MSATDSIQAGQGSIDCQIAGGIAYVTISNPEKRNALTRHMCLELKALARSLHTEPSAEVIALSGAGADFSAGVTIDQLPSILFEPASEGGYTDHFSAADAALAQVTKPTVALVQGVCMGGGWQIASACDFILTSSNARFAVTPAKIGILYPRSGLDRLVRQVGPARAKYILMTGRTFNAEQAQSLGLVADVIDEDEFQTESSALLDTLLKRSRFTQVKTKEYIDACSGPREHLDPLWSRSWEEMVHGEDKEIGIESFRQRKDPRFSWTPV
ncbi:enoyl-CoA hydratase/isomerase family protein [Nesterenkonia alkaliphila]|uniref:Enoyl-CoA hydratase/isomerase family protein n=1 Tax=Nesterenkonia alkaliphila TaxID=1463631 RepID=A0A7K1UI12_9MICC|nr:enoyl-CoA hydratase/isomerase family protein [Nesterenkonia alkaliphila]MVT26089.1 enoyl-CoA hydratase/isomerase family protein [Nesterenkonia alkaliphila]GFZ79314.1 enoyl-CoA hydratase [Nesterenkonia alkaliphila]